MEEYNANDFETELGLNREKLIHLALLLGSDYTEGVAGIGIVNAVSHPELVHKIRYVIAVIKNLIVFSSKRQ